MRTITHTGFSQTRRPAGNTGPDVECSSKSIQSNGQVRAEKSVDVASVLETDEFHATGLVISSKTRVSHHPLPGILKLQGGMEQCNGIRLCVNDDDNMTLEMNWD